MTDSEIRAALGELGLRVAALEERVANIAHVLMKLHRQQILRPGEHR